MRSDVDRLRDILEAVDAIGKYTSQGRSLFDSDELVRIFCLHHIEIVGEAASRLSEELRKRHPVAPWRNIIAMRNALIHGYFDVDWEIVWAVASNELQPLKEAIGGILTAEKWTP